MSFYHVIENEKTKMLLFNISKFFVLRGYISPFTILKVKKTHVPSNNPVMTNEPIKMIILPLTARHPIFYSKGQNFNLMISPSFIYIYIYIYASKFDNNEIQITFFTIPL
jgi:hypothetical protein